MVNKKIITRNKARPHPVTGHKRALYICHRLVSAYVVISKSLAGGGEISLQLRVKSL